MVRKIFFDDGAKGVLLLLLISQLFFTNGILLFAGMVVFFILISNIQQPFKPSVFTIMLLYHFLQISAGIWYSNYLEKDIDFRSPSTTYATIASYAGLLFLFLPIIYYQNKIELDSTSTQIPGIGLCTFQFAGRCLLCQYRCS